MVRYVGADDFDMGGNKATNTADGTADSDVLTTDQLLTQQGVRSGKTIYVQLSGDSAPSSPVAGDIRIIES